MREEHRTLDIATIDYDPDNPRIKKALEKYGDKLNAERMHFALSSATEGSQNVSSYTSLRDSIRASGGVMSPITVMAKDDRYICIDGNTRLAIYKQFIREGTPGPWEQIKAIVLEDASQRDIETIRVSAHLVGAREWPAYEKARYLHYLRNEQLMSYSEMIMLCGGNKADIERQIDAYHDMNEFYRDKVDDSAFHIDRFSGFVELQRPGIKDAIFETGFELENFGEWIRDGKIHPLIYVRQLPQVLRDEEAKEIFLKGGVRSIESAVKKLDQKQGQDKEEVDLKTASLDQLTIALTRRINDLPYTEMRALKDKEQAEASEQVGNLETLSLRLRDLLQDVSE